MAERPTPEAVFKRMVERQPTIFYAAPTLYAALLASPNLPERTRLKLRICTSAGEALPADIGRRWTERTGVEILDGIGSTEMLHIFLSNRPGEVRYGTTGKPVPGYQVRLVDDQGNAITRPGELGELQICGPTSALMYWNQRERTKSTFQGPWTRSGDKYSVDEQGYHTRANDERAEGRSCVAVPGGDLHRPPRRHHSPADSHQEGRRARYRAGSALRRRDAGAHACGRAADRLRDRRRLARGGGGEVRPAREGSDRAHREGAAGAASPGGVVDRRSRRPRRRQDPDPLI